LGRRVVLPSSFTGGPRHMHQLYHDAMAIVRKFGKPDLFITFTCNPNWPEIASNLKRGEVANDRPDLVGRVFRMKLDALLDELVKDGIFGRVVADVHTVEFQKR
jgi:Helitron helicase-like domain at N-terminus